MGGTWGSYTFGSHAWGEDPSMSFRYSIYRMVVSGLRRLDESGSGNLEKFCYMLDRAWEDLIYSRGSELTTLFEIDEISDKWLKHLAPLLGFTKDLSYTATDEELRKILSLAMPYWNNKPSELSVVDYAIRMVTGNRFRTNNYFDFRVQIDETCITEELEDFDPHMIDFGHDYFTGTRMTPALANTPIFADLPSPGYFTDLHQFRYLLIDNDLVNPGNNGLYKIIQCYGSAVQLDPSTLIPYPSLLYETSWKLLHYRDEYYTEVRLVDDGVGTLNVIDIQTSFSTDEKIYGAVSGATGYLVSQDVVDDMAAISLRNIKGRFEPNETVNGDSGGEATVKNLDGVLNRELLGFLMGGDTVKPLSERIDVAYVDFLDQFITPGDLDQWEIVAGIPTVPSPGGYALFPSGAIVTYDHPTNEWIDQILLFKLEAVNSDSIANCYFCRSGVFSVFSVQINYATKDVKLIYFITTIATVNLPYLKEGVEDVIRIETEYTSPNLIVRVKVNGNLEIDTSYGVGAGFVGGGIGFGSGTNPVKLKIVEVATVPIDVIRIGPNP